MKQLAKRKRKRRKQKVPANSSDAQLGPDSDDDKPLSVLKCPREEQTDIHAKMETKKQETLEE